VTEEIGPISPNEIDDLLEQTTARPEASTSNSVFPEGGRLMAVVEWNHTKAVGMIGFSDQ
jgi:hypothetical protein